MKILVWSRHRYPAYADEGCGLRAMAFPSNSGQFVTDCLVKGLAELGHEVFYLLDGGAARPLPEGVTLVAEASREAEVFHNVESESKPWVRTIHLDAGLLGVERAAAPPNWVYVSRTLAASYGSERFVLNGIDPGVCVYSESKGDYFLFVSNMDRAEGKGLGLALSLCEELGFRLVVAGASRDASVIERVAGMCRAGGAEYVGDVRGARKAELFAGARALLFPTTLNEAFGLVVAEALMSGTPVICSDSGACPEVVSEEVGFVCRTRAEYVEAAGRVGRISPRACREKALKEFHYLRMAADYVKQYELELAGRA
ncbi:MAG: glycosyltransferase [Acidobacteria bacterium]|nr:glycosyltransferase [Acidobacteriota bacterium]